MTTLYVTHPRFADHEKPGHPERPDRIRAVWKRLDETGLARRMLQAPATMAGEDVVALIHSEKYIALLERTETADRTLHLDADTYVNPESWEIARLAAGGVVDAIRAVCAGEAANALAAVRPPGHHATPDRGMGFCLLNNAAIGARYVQKTCGIQRVLIVDYDVHHGNGTEAAFYDDPSVLFISTHESPLYPGTGALTDIGSGAGKGYTINIPMQAGGGDASYGAIFEQVIVPASRRFQPELILVSVGHDAHWIDPLAFMRLSLTGYAHIARTLIQLADELCGGKIIFVMEGGYDLTALSYGMGNIAHALLGDDTVDDPLGPPRDSGAEPDVAPLISRIRRLHNLAD